MTLSEPIVGAAAGSELQGYEVGRWLRSLQRFRVANTPEIAPDVLKATPNLPTVLDAVFSSKSRSAVSSDALRAMQFLLEFSESPAEWVERRSESIVFDSEFTVCRKSVLEMVLDDETIARLPQLHGRVLLPIAVRDRTKTVGTLRLEYEGQEVPALRREQHSPISAVQSG